MLSWELDENIRRREAICLLIPKKGCTSIELRNIVLSVGYSERGCYGKIKELKYLGLIEERNGRIYAHTHAHTHARTSMDTDAKDTQSTQ